MEEPKNNFLSRLSFLKAREHLLILTGSLLLAVLALVVLSTSHIGESGKPEFNEMEKREILSSAADDYMLAGSIEERQAAARRMRSVRSGMEPSAYYQKPPTQQLVDLLRLVLILTILGIGIRLAAVAIRDLAPRKFKQAREKKK
ncbi:MAG TPA: hypothetical protein ENN67_07050 [Firmicutes bacterium]|mgnify:CR=1 FL=1|nr:hypothetical protein [Bacillota bacterium]